jgi:very-short-patch-repair endonuclease
MKKLTTDEFIEKSKKTHGDIFDYSLSEYKDATTKIKIICQNGHIFEQRPSDHYNGHGCNICKNEKFSKSKLIDLDVVKNKLYNKYSDIFIFDFTNYETLESKIKCTCQKHGDFNIRVSSLLKGKNCWQCNNTQPFKSNINLFIEKANKIHNNFFDYSKSIYKHSKQKLTIICPNHGEFEQTPNAHLKGQGCPICNMSKGERKIRTWFLNNNIDFKPQYNFEKLKKYHFDYYLPKFNFCVEYDGEYHYNSYQRIGGDDKLLKIKKRDNVKNKFCLDNNIKILRIPYWEYGNINKILNENLM